MLNSFDNTKQALLAILRTHQLDDVDNTLQSIEYTILPDLIKIDDKEKAIKALNSFQNVPSIDEIKTQCNGFCGANELVLDYEQKNETNFNYKTFLGCDAVCDPCYENYAVDYIRIVNLFKQLCDKLNMDIYFDEFIQENIKLLINELEKRTE